MHDAGVADSVRFVPFGLYLHSRLRRTWFMAPVLMPARPTDRGRMAEIMLRHGLTPAPPRPQRSAERCATGKGDEVLLATHNSRCPDYTEALPAMFC